MITYESKFWLRSIFAVRGTVLIPVLKRLWWIVGLTAFLVALGQYAPWSAPLFGPIKPIGHSLFGLAVGLLIVFHNNASYDRYWEGRKLWGAMVNSARNLGRGAAAFGGEARPLADLIAAYVLAVKHGLRREADLADVKNLIPAPLFERATRANNPPSILALAMSEWIVSRQRAGAVDTIAAQSLEQMVRMMVDCQGGCERILKTPIPFAYAVHIKQMITLYLVTLPIALIGEMGWAAVPAVAAIGYGMLGIEEAGNEIENPFGPDPNDLPLDTICDTIRHDAVNLTEAGFNDLQKSS